MVKKNNIYKIKFASLIHYDMAHVFHNLNISKSSLKQLPNSFFLAKGEKGFSNSFVKQISS